MSEKTMVTMTMIKADMIGDVWREPGTVVEVQDSVARHWVSAGYATLGGVIGENAPVVSTHELGDFPSAALFAAAGFPTLDAVKALIAEKGDAWPKSVKGMNKTLSSKVSEALEKIAQPQTTEAQETAGTEG
jgi:hypothetical protein